MRDTWRMFAQRTGTGGFRHFGPHDWAAQHGADVAEVELAEDAAGDLYGWIDADGIGGPVLVSGSYAELCHTFRAGDPAAREPLAEQEAGLGRVVRLRAHELQEAR